MCGGALKVSGKPMYSIGSMNTSKYLRRGAKTLALSTASSWALSMSRISLQRQEWMCGIYVHGVFVKPS